MNEKSDTQISFENYISTEIFNDEFFKKLNDMQDVMKIMNELRNSNISSQVNPEVLERSINILDSLACEYIEELEYTSKKLFQDFGEIIGNVLR